MTQGEEVVVSIRPEKVRIAEKAAFNHNCFDGKVANTIYIGSDTHVIVDVSGVPIRVWEQNRISRLDPRSFYTVGQEVSLMLMPENMLVLKNE
jgi:spermidine/putrescine transport system ATP-binding protein